MSYSAKVHKDGPDKLVVASGGTVDIESGGVFAIAGVTVTASAADINSLAGTFTDLDLGASGTAGSLDIFPAHTCTNNGAARNLTLTNVAQSVGSGTLKYPDMASGTGQFVATTSDFKVAVNANAGARTISLAGDVTLAGAFTTTGGAATLTVPAAGATITLIGGLTTTGGAVTIAAPAAGGTLTMTGNVTYTGAFNPTFAIPSSSTWTFPTGGGTLAVATGAETGTSATSFTIDNASGVGKFALSTNTAGTNHTVTLKAPVTSQAVTLTLPDAASDTICALAATQTLAAKTFTSPVINGVTCAAAANNWVLNTGSGTFGTPTGTFTFYGNVAQSGNINVDLSGSGTFKTPTGANTMGGEITVSTGKNITLTNGYVSAGGSTSGAIKLAPIAVGTGTTSIINQAGTINVTLPSATATLPGLGLANAFTAAQTVTLDDTTDGNSTIVTLTHSSSDNNATAGDGVAISLQLENATGTSTVEEWANISAVSTTITNGTEDGDVVIKTMLGGAVMPALTIDASEQSVTVGQNVTDADGISKVTIYPVTTLKGSVVLQAVANNAADAQTIIQNGQSGATSTFTTPTAASGTFALCASAAGAIARGDITEESLMRYQLPLQEWRNVDGTVLDATGAATAFKITNGGFAAGTLTLTGVAADGSTVTSTMCKEFVMPPEYLADQDVKVVVNCKYAATGDPDHTTHTVDVVVYEVADDGTAGALLASAATAITSSAADYTFVVPDAGLTAGDRLMIYVRTVMTEGAGTVGTMTATITAIEVQCDIKG